MRLKIEEASRFHYDHLLRVLRNYFAYDFALFLKTGLPFTGVFPTTGLDEIWDVDENHAYLCYDSDNWITGYTLIRTNQVSMFTDELSTYLYEFWVAPQFRGTGAAKKFFDKIISRHSGRWELFVQTGNERAERFWDKALPRNHVKDAYDRQPRGRDRIYSGYLYSWYTGDVQE